MFVKQRFIIINHTQIRMLFRIFCLLTIAGWFQVQCYVTVPSIYRKAEMALHHYSSHIGHNPVIFSLLNVLVYDKRARAFITDGAIEKSLEDVKKINKNDEQILRRIIYRRKNLEKVNKLSVESKENIESALDTFFAYPNIDDHGTFDLLSNKKKL
jgi:hypothetical protein